MHSDHYADLKILLEHIRPVSLLLIDCNPLPADLLSVCPDCQPTHLQSDIPARLQDLGRFDLGIVANTLEHLDRATAGRILARLRDLHTRRLVVLVPVGKAWQAQRSHWETTDLLGYGMTLMARYPVDGKLLHLYHYAIDTYKLAPDWFNSRHWSHPERWKT